MLVVKWSVFTYCHKFDDFRHALVHQQELIGELLEVSKILTTESWPHQKYFGCHEYLSTFCPVPPMTFYGPLCIHPKKSICIPVGSWPLRYFWAMLLIGVSVICMFSGNFKAKCAVRPPSSRVAAIPDEANARASSFRDLILAKSNEIKNVFPVPPEVSRK